MYYSYEPNISLYALAFGCKCHLCHNSRPTQRWMDGYTLCARLKANTSTNYVPVVMLTAKTRECDKLEGLGQGADAYIEKPFNIQVLRHTIRNLIAARDLLRNKMSGNEMPIDRVEEVRMSTPDEKLMERGAQLLRQGDHNISEVVYACGFDNQSSFSSKFKTQYGMTPSAYIQEFKKRREEQQ